MTPFEILLASRMRELGKSHFDFANLVNLPGSGWESRSADLPFYWEVIKPYCTNEVVLDVGCGSGQLWLSMNSVAKFGTLYAIDVINYNSWPAVRISNIQKRSFFIWYGTPVAVRELHSSLPMPTVALVKNVLYWSTYAEIRHLLFSLPDTIKQVVFTEAAKDDSAPVTQSPPRNFNPLHFPLSFTFSEREYWQDSEDKVWLTSILPDLQAWRKIQATQVLWEPCPQCYRTIEPNYTRFETVYEIMCMSCGFAVRLDCGLNPDATVIRNAWNAKIRMGYTCRN